MFVGFDKVIISDGGQVPMWKTNSFLTNECLVIIRFYKPDKSVLPCMFLNIITVRQTSLCEPIISTDGF